ncbi:MAG: cell division protein ZipA C-terminal FtsZ-binding domain-containing protein, partial [Candidatus Competibacterales bacterium]
ASFELAIAGILAMAIPAVVLLAPVERPFTGVAILEGAHQVQLKLSRSGVLDYLTKEQVDDPRVFRVGLLGEPGTLDLEHIDTLKAPGLMFCAQLPGPLNARATVETMLNVASRMRHHLGGTLCDAKRRKLSDDAVVELRERAHEYDSHYQRWLEAEV